MDRIRTRVRAGMLKEIQGGSNDWLAFADCELKGLLTLRKSGSVQFLVISEFDGILTLKIKSGLQWSIIVIALMPKSYELPEDQRRALHRFESQFLAAIIIVFVLVPKSHHGLPEH
jgi:hypothetical protein